MDDISCKKCGKSPKSLPHHLSKNPECKADYNEEELESERKRRRKLYTKKYYEDNCDTIKLQQKTYVKKNKEDILRNKAVYDLKKRDEISSKKRKHYSENKAQKKQKYDEVKEDRKLQYQSKKDQIAAKYNKEKRSATYQQQKAKKASQYQKEDRLKDFDTSVQFGPIYPCISCERLLFYEGVVKFEYTEQYEKLKQKLRDSNHEELIDCISLKNDKFIVSECLYLCHSCNDSIFKKNKMPSICHLNGMDLTEIPEELKLSTCESILIAKVILFLKIHKCPRSQWPGIKDKIICVPITDNDIQRTVQQLPRMPDEGGLIPLDFTRKLEYTTPVYKEFIRPNAVVGGAKMLKKINPYYKNVKILEEAEYLNICKENDKKGYKSYLQKEESKSDEEPDHESDFNEAFIADDDDEDDDYESEINQDIPGSIDDSSAEGDKQKDSIKDFQFETSNMAMLMDQHLEEGVIVNSSENEKVAKQRSDSNRSFRVAPGEGKVPTDLMRERNWDIKAFPTKHPDGKFGLDFERKTKLTPQQYFCQRILNVDTRFSSDPMYVFAAYYYVLRHQLESRLNISYQRGTLNSKGELENLQDAFTVFDKIPGTFKFWQDARRKLVAELEQHGPFHFFFTLSCADKRWPENFASILSSLGHEVQYTQEQQLLVDGEPIETFLENEDVHEMMKDNVVTITRNFDHRVKMFRKHVMFGQNSPLKLKYFNHRVEFQMRGAAHVHGVVWMDLESHEEEFPGIQKCFNKLQDDQNLSDEECDTLTAVIDKFVSCSLKEPSTCDIVQDVQIHHHTQSCRRGGQYCRFGFPKFPSNRTIIAQPVKDCDEETKLMKIAKGQKILDKAKEALKQLKENYFTSIEEFLESIGVTDNEYYEALSISENGVSIILKRDMDEIYVNQYNSEWLQAWNGNSDFQLCLNYFEIVTYITDYYMKSEGALLDELLEVADELKGMNLRDRMHNLIHSFLKHRQVSLAEALYCLDQSMHLKDSNVKGTYVATGFPSHRSKFLEKVLEGIEKAENLLSVAGREGKFKAKLAIHDKYSKRPLQLEDMCLAQYSMMYETKNVKSVKNLVWTNNCNGSSQTKLVTWEGEKDYIPKNIMLSDNYGYMGCRKEPCILRLHKINKNVDVHEYMYSELLLYRPWWNEMELFEEDFEKCFDLFMLPGDNDTGETRIERVKSILFPHLKNVLEGRARVEEAQIKRNMHIGDTLTPSLQQENAEDEEEGLMVHEDFEILTESWNDVSHVEEGNASELKTNCEKYAQQIFLFDKDEMSSNVRKLSPDQRYVFNVVIKFCKDLVKSRKTGIKSPSPIHLIIHGGAGAGKSTIINTITPWIQATLQTEGDNHSSPYVLKMAPTGLAALNISGMTIHSGLNIMVGNQHRSLSDKVREDLRHQLGNLKVLILDEFSMIPSNMLYQVHLRLQQIKDSQDAFGGVSILLFGDLMQLRPIGGSFIFDEPSNKEFLLYHRMNPLWEKFNVVELTQNHRQGEDKGYADMLNRIRFGTHNDSDLNILEDCVVQESDYGNKDIVFLYGTNENVNACNIEILNNLPGELTTIMAKNIHPPSIVPPIKSNTGCVAETPLLNELNLKIGAKVMLTTNVQTADGLVNGACGTVKGFRRCSNNTNVQLVLVEFEDKKVGAISRDKPENSEFRGSLITPIKKLELSYSSGKKSKQHTHTCKVIQFPLKLSWASTIHKVQGQTVAKPKKISIDFATIFGPAMAYVALSRIQSVSQLKIENLDISKIKCFPSAMSVANKMKEIALNLNPSKWETAVDSSIKVTSLNIVSLKKHLEDLICDNVIMKSDLILLSETSLSACYADEQNIPGFRLHFTDTQRGCGVACYASERINIQKIEQDNSLGYQILYIWLPDLLIINVYRTHLKRSTELLIRGNLDIH